MRSVISLAFIIIFVCSSALAQDLVYPTTAQLSSSLHRLITAANSRYASIDAGPLDAASPDYRKADFHLIPNSRNQLYHAAAPVNDNYMEIMSEGIDETQASTGFGKWKKLFEAALPEFIFLSHLQDTYGEIFFYYDTTQTHIFNLEVYFNPVKKSWSLSLTLRHLTEGDKEFVAKKNKPGIDIIAIQALISKTLTGILKARTNKFQTLRGLELPGQDGGKQFIVQGADFGFDPGPVQFIAVDAAGAATYNLMAAGLEMPVQLTVAYARLVTPELEKEGYTITKDDKAGLVTYTILYNDLPVSVCRMEKANGAITIIVLGG